MTEKRIGPYLIEKKIGAGGMGTVYLAAHEETGEQVAVKILPASLAREPGFVARFNREIDAMHKLKNSHIVEIYDSGVQDETYYYAMEYVPGETLGQRLERENRIPWREVIDYSVQICTALKSAHNTGIIHRDLKPSNLLIAPDGTIKLTDFGVAQVFAAGKLTATGGIIGTAEFMAPEQAQGKRVTKVSDLYALGAVMYAMLTGKAPFSGRSALDIIHKHQFGRFDRPRLIVPDIPYWLDDIVCQLLEKEPDKRFPDAYVLSLRLQEVVKKVELSEKGDTEFGGDVDGTAPTVVAGGPVGEMGAGTLMRDLVRNQIDEMYAESPVSKFFNNTLVLVACLALLIAGGFWWFRPPSVNSGDDDFVSATPGTEFEQFLYRARHFERVGDRDQAERTLLALSSLLEGDPNHKTLYNRTQQRLKALRAGPEISAGQDELLKAALARATRFAEADEVAKARKIWLGIVELYGSDPKAQKFVDRARTQLQQELTAKP